MLLLYRKLLKCVVMKTEEKKSMGKVPQVVFRPSAECSGCYRFHYGHLISGGTFSEDVEQSFWDFLKTIDVPPLSVASFVGKFSESEKEICRFGYFSQEHFDEFVRYFSEFCAAVQLYPGMLVLTFNEEGNED